MGKVKKHENARKSRGRGSTIITTTPFLVGRPPPGKWFSSLRLCGGSGLGEKKTLNTSVVGKNTFKSSHLTNEDRWIDRPELPGDFWVLSGGFRSNMDRSIYPRFGGWIEQSVVFYRSPLEMEPAPGAEAFSGAESIHAPRKGTCPWARSLFWGRI